MYAYFTEQFYQGAKSCVALKVHLSLTYFLLVIVVYFTNYVNN